MYLCIIVLHIIYILTEYTILCIEYFPFSNYFVYVLIHKPARFIYTLHLCKDFYRFVFLYNTNLVV